MGCTKKVVLYAYAKLLTYLPGQGDERLLRIEKVSVTSDERNIGKKSHFVQEIMQTLIQKFCNNAYISMSNTVVYSLSFFEVKS